MKRLLPILMLLLLLTGCGIHRDRDHLSIRPHVEQPTQATTELPDELPVVSSRLELRGAILSLIENWKESGLILIRDYDGDVEQHLSEAIEFTTRQNPTGAYAVDFATGELLQQDGEQYIQMSIVFRRSAAEIDSIVRVNDNKAAYLKIIEALESFSNSLTLKIQNYKNEDFSTYILDYCLANPRTILAIPEFSATVYPEKGTSRILELHFAYPESKEAMRTKLQSVRTIFDSAARYMAMGSNELGCARQLYRYLINRHGLSSIEEQSPYTIAEQMPSMPCYSLLFEDLAHHLSLSVFFQEQCEAAGLRSYIVKGQKGDQPYYWNILQIGEETFHVDLLRCIVEGEKELRLFYAEALLAKGYDWDRAAYPSAPQPVEEDPDPSEPDETGTEAAEPTVTVPEATETEVTETEATETEATEPKATETTPTESSSTTQSETEPADLTDSTEAPIEPTTQTE